MKRLLIIISVIMLTGPALLARRGMHTSQINRFFNQGKDRIGVVAAQSQQQVEKIEVIFRNLTPYREGSSEEPYPLLNRKMKELGDVRDRIKGAAKRMKEINSEVISLTRGKSAIFTDEPAFQTIMDRRKEVQKMVGTIRSDINLAKGLMGEMTSLARRYRITLVNLSVIKGKLDDFNSKLQDYLKDGRGKIARVRTQLDSSGAKQYSRDVIARQKKILMKLEKHLSWLEGKNNEIQSLYSQLEKESQGKASFYTGPGMISHDIIGTLQGSGKEINERVKKIRELIEEYRRNFNR
jgi:hypothetical protein